MANYGNFLQYAGQKTGIDVGFGKMFLVYSNQTSKAASELDAVSINNEIATGTIIGVIKGWHTIAGAPVAEVSVERPGTYEKKLIRPEILADTLTFESGMANNEVLGDIVKAGSLNCILLDDQGNAYGEYNQEYGTIGTMLVNFSEKKTSGLQTDYAAEKTVAITARYLVKNLSVIYAATETELITLKDLIYGQLSSFSIGTNNNSKLILNLRYKSTNDPLTETLVPLDVTIKGMPSNISISSITSDNAGNFTFNFSGSMNGGTLLISISGTTFYMKETPFIVG
jgi:hypothetical protein